MSRTLDDFLAEDDRTHAETKANQQGPNLPAPANDVAPVAGPRSFNPLSGESLATTAFEPSLPAAPAQEPQGVDMSLTLDDFLASADRSSQTATKLVLSSVETVDPDKYASDTKRAQQFVREVNPSLAGLPTDLYAGNSALFEQRIQQKRDSTILQGSPILTSWLRDTDNASMARDDLAQLGALEGFFKASGNMIARGALRVPQSVQQYLSDQARRRAGDMEKGFFEILAEEQQAPGILDTLVGPNAGLDMLDLYGRNPGTLFAAATRYGLSGISSVLGVEEGEAAAGFQLAAGQYAKQISDLPMSETASSFRDVVFRDDAPTDLMGAVSNFATNAASNPGGMLAFLLETAGETLPSLAVATGVTAATRNPAAGITTMGLSSGLTERYTEPVSFFQDKGFDVSTPEGVAGIMARPDLLKEAGERGYVRGWIIGALDTASGGIAGRALASNPAGDMVLQSLAQMVSGGGGEALAQYATDGEVDWNEVIVEALAEMATAPIEVAGVAGRRLGQMNREAQNAATRRDLFAALSGQSTDSKLRARMPEKFRAFVAQATKDGPLENVSIPANEFIDYFQSVGIDPYLIADRLGGRGDMLRQAVELGADFEIATADYGAHLAGTAHDAFLIDNMRFSPLEMTFAESQRFNAEIPQVMEQLQAQENAGEIATLERDDAGQRIYDSVRDRLVGIGIAPERAETEAATHAAFYRAMAERSGMTVEQLEQRYPLVRLLGNRIDAPQARSIDELGRQLAGMRARIQRRGGSTVERESVSTADRQFDALEEALTDLGLDPNTATDEDVRNALRAVPGPNRTEAVQALNQFAGVQAQGADLDALAAAKADLDAGADPDEVFQGRGWFRGSDNIWRFELEDTEAEFTSSVSDAFETASEDGTAEVRASTLDDILYHPELFEAYPILRGTRVRIRFDTTQGDLFQEGASGAPNDRYPGGVILIDAGSVETARGVLLHEIAHLIQAIEGFALGGNADTSVDYDTYFRQAGEVEARNVASRDFDRRNQSESLLRYLEEMGITNPLKRSPVFTQDTGQSNILVTFADTTSYHQSVEPRLFDTLEYDQRKRTAARIRGQARIAMRDGRLDTGSSVIELMRDADLSTFQHESAHLFLSIYRDMAVDPSATQEVRDDYEAIRQWWRANAADVARDAGNGVTAADVERAIDTGTSGDAAKDAAIDVGMQEQWARGFESYLLEGKAPSNALRQAFDRFRAWLVDVYRQATALNVNVTPEIRAVFDRMLATDSELQSVRDADPSAALVADTAAKLQMSPEAYGALVELHEQARAQAQANLLRSVMAPIKRAREQWWADEMEKVRDEVEPQINGRPVYRAIEWMGNSRWLGDDAPEGLADIRLSKDILVERYGAGILTTLPRGKRTIYAVEGGVDPNDVADLFGFDSGDALVRAMEQAPNRRETVQAEVDRIMRERHGDPLTDGSIQQDALDAYYNDKRSLVLAAELTAIDKRAAALVRRSDPDAARRVGRGLSRSLSAAAARAAARKMISTMPVRRALAANRYLAAERKAANEAQVAYGKDDWITAADAKRRQLLNHSLYMESRYLAEEAQKLENRTARLKRAGTRKNLAGRYLDALDEAMEKFGFKRTPPSGFVPGRARALVDALNAEGRGNVVAISDAIVDQANVIDWRDMTVQQMHELHDGLKNLEHIARNEKKVVDADRAMEMDDIVQGLETAFADNVKSVAPNRLPNDPKERRRRTALSFLSAVVNSDTIVRTIDGFKDFGAAYEGIKRRIDEATARLQVMRREAAENFDQLYSVYSRTERNQMSIRKKIDGLPDSMSKWDLIAVALNLGNDQNRQRITDRDVRGSFTDAQIDIILGQLDERDARFIQSSWDMINAYWPQIVEREKRVTGVAPTKVEGTPIEIAGVQLRGGYYPLKYDPRLSARVAEETTAELAMNSINGRFGKAATRNGHLKERSSASGRPVMIDIAVMHQHVNQVVHDLALSEAVNGTWRVLQDARVKDLFTQAGRQVDLQSLEMWTQDVAAGEQRSGAAVASVARKLKSGFTLSKLAFNLSTVAVQLTGISQSMVVLGKADFTRGLMRMLGQGWNGRNLTAAQWAIDASEFMRERQTTFNKDIQDVLGDVRTGPTQGRVERFTSEVLGPAGFWLMQKVQFYTVDLPTWIGAYEQGKRRGYDDDQAVLHADRIVVRAQAGGAFADRTPIERGTIGGTERQSDVVRLFTALGSYMFAKANVALQRTRETDFRNPLQVVNYTSDMFMLFLVEAILYNLIKGTLPGMKEDDDEEDEDAAAWATFLAKETSVSIMSTIPFVRDLGSMLQGFEAGGTYGGVLSTLGKPLTGIGGALAEDGEIDRRLVKDTMNMFGMLTGAPSTQLNRIIDAAWRQSEGDDVSPIEYVLGAKR